MVVGGSPFEAQRELAEGRAVAWLDRGVVTVTGPDRLSWLDSITSQALAGLAPGDSAETLLLDPNGRVERAMRVVDDGTATWLIVDGAEQAAELAAWLDRMRFLLRVEVADRSSEQLVLGWFGGAGALEGADVALEAAASVLWRDPWREVAEGGWQYAAAEGHPAAAWAWTEAVLPVSYEPSAPVVPEAAYDALRVAAWRPSFSREVDERTIPHELDWLRSAVHLAKGCYRGQETVAKVHNLGHPPRRLVFLHVDGSSDVLPAHGDEVVLAGGEDAVGAVTSAANHWQLGPIALAVVKRTTDPAATLEIVHEGVRLAAAQEVVVPPGAGATAEVPRIPRLGAVRR